MALKFSESPAVTVREIDLTGVVPAVTSTTGAFVGDFNWGPVNTPVLVGTESELASTFGSPLAGDAFAGDFLSVAHFLKYSSSAFVVRAPKSGSATSSATPFFAKYPGALGNTLSADVCDASTWEVTDSDGTVVSSWTYQSLFSSAPEGDELHVVVLSGTDVVDTFAYVSTDPTAKLDNGSTNFVTDVVTSGSSWVDLPQEDLSNHKLPLSMTHSWVYP